MNKSFSKEDQTLLLAAVVLGAVTAGTLSWLCFTRNGKAFIKSRVKDLAAVVVCRQTGLSHKYVRPVMDVIVD